MLDVELHFAVLFLLLRVVAFAIFAVVLTKQIRLLRSSTVPKYASRTRYVLTGTVMVLLLAQLVPIVMDIFDAIRTDMSLVAIIIYRLSNSISAVATAVGMYFLYKDN